jgi:uncharacterized protein (DUF433 family)
MAGEPGHFDGAEVPAENGPTASGPRLVERDGVAFVEGCDIPIWRLEMSRRAGSASAALLAVFPMLTPEGLELAFVYARQHQEEIDARIRERGPTEVPAWDEGGDAEAAIQADLDGMFAEYGEVFRRLGEVRTLC